MKLAVMTRRDPDGMYVAICPSLPWCVSRGATVQEALDKHESVVRLHLAAVTDFVPDHVQFRVVQA